MNRQISKEETMFKRKERGKKKKSEEETMNISLKIYGPWQKLSFQALYLRDKKKKQFHFFPSLIFLFLFGYEIAKITLCYSFLELY